VALNVWAVQKNVAASGHERESRLGFRGPNLRKRRFEKRRNEKNKKKKKGMYLNMHMLYLKIARASGEAILGTQRYFSMLMPTDL